jgi:hypothetical protein
MPQPVTNCHDFTYHPYETERSHPPHQHEAAAEAFGLCPRKRKKTTPECFGGSNTFGERLYQVISIRHMQIPFETYHFQVESMMRNLAFFPPENITFISNRHRAEFDAEALSLFSQPCFQRLIANKPKTFSIPCYNGIRPQAEL